MSLSTWKDEFYHRAPLKRMTALEAADHSLLKWEGLLPENLKKHKLVLKKDLTVYCKEEDQNFYFDSDNCSLCVKYMRKERTITWLDRCTPCPLVKSGTASCLTEGPFNYAMDHNKPQLMIDALRNTVVWILEHDVK